MKLFRQIDKSKEVEFDTYLIIKQIKSVNYYRETTIKVVEWVDQTK